MNGEHRARLEGIGSELDVGSKDIVDVRKATLKRRLFKMTIGSVAAVAAIVIGFLTGEAIRGSVNPTSTYPFLPALLFASISTDPRVNAAALRSMLSPRRYTLIAILTVTSIAFVVGALIGATNPWQFWGQPPKAPTLYGVASRTSNDQ